MRFIFEIICLTGLLFACAVASAEPYLGIPPGTSLKSIREQFPNAVFIDMKPAWAPKNIRLFQMQGYGLGGTVVIKLDDIRPILKQSMGLESSAVDEDEAYFVASGFRLVPDEPIKLDTLIMKYGRPDKSGIDRNLNKFVSWLQRGVSATVSNKNDGYVSMIEYIYTKEELENSVAPSKH